MLLQILDFGFSVVRSVGSIFANKTVFSHIFPNRIKTTTIEPQSLKQEFNSYSLETSFDMLNNIELNDLESIMVIEFAQGLQSDTELGFL